MFSAAFACRFENFQWRHFESPAIVSASCWCKARYPSPTKAIHKSIRRININHNLKTIKQDIPNKSPKHHLKATKHNDLKDTIYYTKQQAAIIDHRNNNHKNHPTATIIIQQSFNNHPVTSTPQPPTTTILQQQKPF